MTIHTMNQESEVYITSVIRDGKKYTQIHRKIKKEVKSIDLIIEERKRNWVPFGNGDEHTVELEPVHWILPKLKKEPIEEQQKPKGLIICSNCKIPGHFSKNCKVAAANKDEIKTDRIFYKGITCNRCKQEGHFSKDCKNIIKDENITLKVSNLPDDVTVRQLEDIFTKYGDLKREGNRRSIHLAKKYGTELFSGTAYITFSEKQEGMQAMKMLQNTRIGICIIDIEVAKQRE